MTPDGNLYADAQEMGENQAPPAARENRAIFHPVVDFLCLGGASLLVLPAALLIPEARISTVVILMVLLSDVCNHPHFAASYEIFYRGVVAKICGDALPLGLRIRYVVAGALVPALLIGFFAIGFMNADGRMLAWGGNLMLLLAGWHYNKQGYGMLIVDSVVQRCFFTEVEKDILRYNAHVGWMLLWLLGNWYVSERNLWNLKYYSFAVPEWALYGVGAIALVFTALALRIFARRALGQGGKLPINGTVAYITTLYVWFAAGFHPVTLLIVPFFHSLQYLLIVGRFEINRNQAIADKAKSTRRIRVVRLLNFPIWAVLIGLTGFWWAPRLLERFVDYDHQAIGGTAFFFMFWIFINVHHYFIDNVIWRRDNPETGKYLFASEPGRR